MKVRLYFAVIVLIYAASIKYSNAQNEQIESKTISSLTSGMKIYSGFFNFYWQEESGQIWLEIDKLNVEFLYINSLPAGIGSNDIGLDRNQLGDSRIVKFIRSGPKVLLIQPNYNYRALSKNRDEGKSVEDAFAQSVLWGFEIEAEKKGHVLVDLTSFLLRDAHGVSARLRESAQGNYSVNNSRSALHMERTINFPKNSEFESIITFTGDGAGLHLRSVIPSAEAVTVRMHHSFVQLPDAEFQPRNFDPRCGYGAISFQDYATPIGAPLIKQFIRRHRLQKKNPSAKQSEAVKPIIYYLDRGAPEPIRSALLEGASWWDQAFRAAGYKNAFQVKELPEGVDPMDVRYNVINWVHRSTRGWSYGSSVTDPRTGEIIKGHVLLGSLRVRQDFLIAQGLIKAYKEGKKTNPGMLEMALARLRQLSAHEVGHTLGLSHNFAASHDNRASVMDYPHPYITIDDQGSIDFSKAYKEGIGIWDKRTILYGYQDFTDEVDEERALKELLIKNNELGLSYISDEGARPVSGAHPYAHLWDNGVSAVDELRRISEVRRVALQSFGKENIPEGSPMALLENVLVPLYFAHRYQVEAVSKIIGGVEYSYSVRGDGQIINKMVEDEVQREALDVLLQTLKPEYLVISEQIIDLIPPQPMGYTRGRELLKIHTGLTFDPIGAAESSANHSISFLLNPQRLARLIEQHARNNERLSVVELIDQLLDATDIKENHSGMQIELARMTQKLTVNHLLDISGDNNIMQQVSAIARLKIAQFEAKILVLIDRTSDLDQLAHLVYLKERIRLFRENPAAFEVSPALSLPDGSPIGCGW